MSFMMTTAQMQNEIKSVTRRFGWWTLKAGDKVMAVKKAMGLRKGEQMQKLYPIEIVSVRKERLCDITKAECIKEGFPDFEPKDFIEMLCNHYNVEPTKEINRIEFRKV
jgi:hypothetical protein